MKKKSFLIFILIICIGIFGFTLAYFLNDKQTVSQVETEKYGATFSEIFESPDNWEPGDTTEKQVFVTNNYDVDMAVRISYTDGWEALDGTSLSNIQNGKMVAIINFANTNDWVKIGNYYYYKYRLEKNERTSNFIDSVTFNENVDFSVSCGSSNNQNISNCTYSTGNYFGATYSLDINIETIQFDNYKNIWGNDITLLDEKIFTGAESLVKKSNSSSITTYSAGDTHEMYVFSHSATSQTAASTEYRYIGNDPYNYVYFNCDDGGTNCEIWRILGVFDVDDGTGNIEQRMKLVRSSDFANGMYWNSSNNNDWTNASLKSFLNGDYYNRTSSASTYGLKASARNMIGDAKYYLGAVSWDSTNSNYGGTSKIYGEERGNVLCGSCGSDTTKLAWTGKVGLMYPSDVYMAYGNGVNATCYDNPRECYSSASNAQTGWVFNSNIRDGQSSLQLTWLLSSSTISSNYVLYVYSNGALDATGPSSYSLWVRPVVYLSSDVLIKSGTGSGNDPYVLSK